MKLFNAKQASPAEVATHLAREVGAETDDFLRYTHDKAAHVAALADALAQLLDLGGEDRSALRLAGLVQDTGMLAMRRDYITRVGELTPEERLDLARHPVVGEGEAARHGFTRGVQLLIRWHHERWDGSGYPDALCGEAIPLPARILRVADSYAALTAVRPWRDAYTNEEALAHLRDGAGLDFDARIVDLFSRISIESAPGATRE